MKNKDSSAAKWHQALVDRRRHLEAALQAERADTEASGEIAVRDIADCATQNQHIDILVTLRRSQMQELIAIDAALDVLKPADTADAFAVGRQLMNDD